MNKKVLIISSSPQKGGSSDILCDAFAEGAKAAGNEKGTVNGGKFIAEAKALGKSVQ